MKKKNSRLDHLILCLMLLALSLPGIAPAATERRTALVIGNSSYNTGSPRNPVNDDDMAAALKRLGFDVTLEESHAAGYGRALLVVGMKRVSLVVRSYHCIGGA